MQQSICFAYWCVCLFVCLLLVAYRDLKSARLNIFQRTCSDDPVIGQFKSEESSKGTLKSDTQ